MINRDPHAMRRGAAAFLASLLLTQAPIAKTGWAQPTTGTTTPTTTPTTPSTPAAGTPTTGTPAPTTPTPATPAPASPTTKAPASSANPPVADLSSPLPSGAPKQDLSASTSLALQLTAEERQELKEYEKTFERYKHAADEHQNRIRAVLRGEYDARIGKLRDKYSKSILNADAIQRKEHLAAIARLERFIVDYPDHPQFTPDTMFRLADLYLDESNYQFEKASEAAVAAETDPNSPDAEGIPPSTADYNKSLALWQRIIATFPDYRQRPGTLYLWAYYLKQTGEERKSLQVFRSLVCSNKYKPDGEPPPLPNRDQVRLSTAVAKQNFANPYTDCVAATDNQELIEDAWVRGIGDIHFLTPGELNEAISAFEKVARNKQSKFYDEALYKLAWSYYRNDDFLKGVAAFDESVVYSDSLVTQGKEPLPLRPEAIQYIAISFTDPWSVDEQQDPARSFERAYDFYKDRFAEPHVRDVFEQLGDAFTVFEAHDQAMDSYRLILDKWPLHPNSPLIHQKIVNAFESKGDKDGADSEAAKLVQRYAQGSEWYKANETNREAMEWQAKINERMLRAAAENLHKSAQEARKEYLANPSEEGKTHFIDLYRRSAELYRRFIDEYPTSEEVYEFTYRIGETLYFAEDFLTSVEYYRWVRDHRDLSSTRFEKSARSIVQAYQKELERQIAAGTVKQPPVLTLDQLKAVQTPLNPTAIPQIEKDMQTALDEYQTLVNDPTTAPNMGLLAAITSYRYFHMDDAVLRFQKVVDKFCGTSEATKAKDGLLAIYEVRNEDAKFKATNEKFIASKCGNTQDIQLAQAQNRSKEFREAEELFTNQKFNLAAIAFYKYYKQAQPDDLNKPVGLYNSAVAYEKAGKPKTAVYLFKEFTDNPAKEFRQSEYYLPALYLTAVAYYKAFDYKNAVNVYLDVVKVANEKGRKPPAGERSLEQIRLDALFNAAVLRELDRVFKDPKSEPGTGAASLYRRYAEAEPDRRKADRALWAVGRVWVASQDYDAANKAYNEWRKKYGKDAGNADDYVFSYYTLAKQHEKRGHKSDTAKFKAETIKAWTAVGGPANTAAADMAAEFDFETAEGLYNREFAPYKIKKTPKTKKEADKVLNDLDALTKKTQDRFVGLGKYNSGPWGMAALVRVGDVQYFSGIKITEIPIPKELEQLDAKFPEKEIILKYQDAITQLVKPKEEAARQQWTKVVEAGKSQGVSNKWTQLGQERLHDFISQDEFPVLRESMTEGTERP